jgi:long-chain acyl-CoA synthetase
MVTLNDLIARHAEERPQETAIVFKGVKTSYATLSQQIERWAGVLSSAGVQAGDAFGLVMKNSPEFVITFFALMRLGARAVPVNFLYKSHDIANIFADAGIVGVLAQPAYIRTVQEAAQKLPRLKNIFVTGPRAPSEGNISSFYDDLMKAPSLPVPQTSSATPDTVAMLLYTSGTTGEPKGVMLTHKNFLANAQQCRDMVSSLSRKDIFLCLLPMFHSFAWTVCVVVPLLLGCKIVISESIQPFGNVIKQIFKERVSIFVAVPPIYAALLRVPFWWPMKWINPLRLCISGAAALPTPVHGKFEKKFGVPLLEGYGLTEASPVVTLNPEKKRLPGSIGKALPGIDLRFISDSGEDVPVGEVGEICIRGDNVMKGYFNKETATRDAFLDDAHLWLKSGDLGFVNADGYVHISDRKKDLIIVKGLNVYPKDIEDVLLGHPAVQEAAVVGIVDETGDERIRAYVTLKEGAGVDKQELSKLCRSKLAAYKCPKDLEIRKDLPKNVFGKILKRELRKT